MGGAADADARLAAKDAHVDPARAAHVDALTDGELRARADLVVLDPAHPALYGRRRDTLLDSWIFAAATSPVRDVVAGGRHVVRGGRHVDRERIEARFRRCIDGVTARA